MHPSFVSGTDASGAIPVWFVTAANWAEIRQQLGAHCGDFAEAAGFTPKPGQHLLLPGANGISGVLFGLDSADAPASDPFLPGRLSELLPKGIYRFANAPHDERLAALAFALGSYRFARYRKAEERQVQLSLSNRVGGEELTRIVEGAVLARDLINTPANDMGPAELEQATRDLAARHDADVHVIVGDELLAANFPLVHAVGRAAAKPPRLIDMTWGNPAHPKVTLVGKGVCFDSGGLDIKPSSAMLNMKKDMGGAATVLALGHMVMGAKLKVRLRVLIPAVENAVAGGAFRPRDVYASRKGLTVEIGNTDAEGRLVLADALALADAEGPDLLVDMGTLTGAARVALGPDLPAFYTDDETWAAELTRYAAAENDPVWRLPLWGPYQTMLDSKVADINNVSSNSFAGSITCALFLQRFVEAAKVWLHFDIFAWNASSRPARPEGGECQVARALYAALKDRYA
jgi:leucyl aminopeptidase